MNVMNRQRTLSNGGGVDLRQRRTTAQQSGLKVEEDDVQVVRQSTQRHAEKGELQQSSSSRDPEQQRKW
ncbi:hypothetical protein AAVH_07955 [Aphelenchoides avenae]|nr:hypothetical protein AAVH_07955 [Aphelenchus avenae]